MARSVPKSSNKLFKLINTVVWRGEKWATVRSPLINAAFIQLLLITLHTHLSSASRFRNACQVKTIIINLLINDAFTK
jgi:hypothetical protein